MVWALTPVDASSGAQGYYIFAAGTYKVGRKDCDVIIKIDTSISRIHAEISIEKMAAWDPHSGVPASPSYVSVVDRSKYGTFVNKVQGTQGSRLRKDDGVMLTDGDSVTFGTSNSTFRLSFVPIIVFFHGKKSARIDQSLQTTMTSIGAYVTRKWSAECTHVLVDQLSPLTTELLDAIVTKKTIIMGNWFKAMTEKNIRTEIPSCAQYIATLTIDGMEINMVEIKLIENCLAGYNFILGSSEKYKFGEKLQELLESIGAKYTSIDEFCANSQDSGAGEIDQQILVIPAKYPLEFSKIRPLFPLSKITDVKLFAAILSGRLEAAAIEPPAYIITSSNTTDETIMADSDVEIDTAISDHTVADSNSKHHIQHISDHKTEEEIITTDHSAVNLGETNVNINIQKDLEKDENLKPMEWSVQVIEKAPIHGSKAGVKDVQVINKVQTDENLKSSRDMTCDVFINKVPKDDNMDTRRDETCHVIFSQDLVKMVLRPARAMSTETEGINFKRFRKRETVSGNSFRALTPFAREPYRESNYESNILTDFMREEKRRKQMETIADDLFNNQKAKKKAAAGSSIHTMLTGRR